MKPNWLKGANAQVEENKLETAAKAARQEAVELLHGNCLPLSALAEGPIRTTHQLCNQAVFILDNGKYASIGLPSNLDGWDSAIDTQMYVSIEDAMKLGLLPEKLAQRILAADNAWNQQRAERVAEADLFRAIQAVGVIQANKLIKGVEK